MTRLRVLLRVLIVLTALAPIAGWAEDARFFSALNDIPLMPGLYELTEEAVVFDKPEGRIVESAAVTETQEAAKIRAFYAETLPQLGWQKVPAAKNAKGADSYRKQGETLTVRTEARRQLKILRLSLSPTP